MRIRQVDAEILLLYSVLETRAVLQHINQSLIRHDNVANGCVKHGRAVVESYIAQPVGYLDRTRLLGMRLLIVSDVVAHV